MDCREFDRVWNAWLDAPRDDRAADRDLTREMQAAGEHARDCAACGRAHVGYEALHRALEAWGPDTRALAGPPRGLAERVITALPNMGRTLPASPRRIPRPWSGLILGFAAAAAAVMALVVAPDRGRNEPGRTRRSAASGRSDSHVLGESLVEVTAATWDLARSAAVPAARLGRGVLEAATRADDATEEGASVTLTSVLRGPIDLAPSSTLFQEFGERVSAGVRPLSSTARRAFDFLRAPTFEPNGRRIGPPTSKGA